LAELLYANATGLPLKEAAAALRRCEPEVRESYYAEAKRRRAETEAKRRGD
jgi:hypothetical protein